MIEDHGVTNTTLRQEQFKNDILAVAKYPEGKRILSELVKDDKCLIGKFNGNSIDAYMHGRAHIAIEWRKKLREVLPHSLFVSIIFPEEK